MHPTYECMYVYVLIQFFFSFDLINIQCINIFLRHAYIILSIIYKKLSKVHFLYLHFEIYSVEISQKMVQFINRRIQIVKM